MSNASNTNTADSLAVTIRRCCRQHELLQAGVLLVAVSGGADSVCLLHLLQQLAPEFDVTLHVAHFHHGLRAAADEDAAFVATLADRLGLATTFGAGNVAAEAATSGHSLEAAAHDLRWAFLEGTRRRIGASAVAIGHTADDQAETVLLHLLRGAGLGGLAGLAPRQEPVVRPLLAIRHGACVAWCQAHGVAWREDASNAEPWCGRNAVRLTVLPFLRRYNPAIDGALATTAEALQTDLAYLQEQADAARRALIKHDQDGIDNLDLAGYQALPEAVRRHVLIRWLGDRLAYAHVRAVDALLLHGRPGGAVGVPGDRQVIRQYVDAVLTPVASSPHPPPVTIAVPGVTSAAAWRCRIMADQRPVPADQSHGPWSVDLDADAVALPLTLRSRRPGDRIRLPGVAGTKKVQDILVDAKVPRRDRDRVGVIEAANGIVWLAGYRIAAWARPTAATSRILRLTVAPMEATEAAMEELCP